MLTLNKKFIIILFSFVLLCNLFIGKSLAIVKETSDFYINDSANVLDNNTEQYIIDINKKLYEKVGAQIVVVTVNNLEGKSIEDYSTELFRSYGIGNKQKNNGVLFIVSIEDRRTRIEVGYGLEGRLTDGKTGRILDNCVVPYFKDDNWNDGIRNGFNAILSEVCEEYSITIDGAEEYSSAEGADYSLTFKDIVQFSTALIVFIICLITRVIFSEHTSRKWLAGLRSRHYCNNY